MADLGKHLGLKLHMGVALIANNFVRTIIKTKIMLYWYCSFMHSKRCFNSCIFLNQAHMAKGCVRLVF